MTGRKSFSGEFWSLLVSIFGAYAMILATALILTGTRGGFNSEDMRFANERGYCLSINALDISHVKPECFKYYEK